MGIQFLLGKSGTGKSDYILDELRQKLRAHPQGPAIFYIVPDQMTFQQEYALFNEDIQGSMRAQVMSFSRLSWRILQETGGGTRPFISSIGIQMMLRKIIEEKGSQWHVFQKAIEKQGFLTKLEDMITEFKRYQVTPEMLQMKIDDINQFVHKDPNEVGLTNKLKDIIYIYEKLMIQLQNQYIDAEDQLELLIEKIPESPILSDAELYFDGFHRFTPQELSVIETLMKRCKHMTIALTVDPESLAAISELDLFYQTSETYHTLKDIAEVNGIPIEAPIILSTANGRFKDRPYFDQICFTPQELSVIETLMKRCKHMTIALTVDPESLAAISELDLFYQTSETYHTLKDIAEVNGIPIEAPIILSTANGRFKDRPYFD